jgi:diacylglycerol O-acyltransferase / wax synthase
MWSLDADPLLRSTFMSVTFLDRPPDFGRLRRRVAQAVATTPALSHRVAGTADFDLRTPRWEPDPAFDLDMHLRRIGAPWPGTRRQVLDLAALMAQDPLDRGRPLWQFTVVEGLEDGEAALLAKMHHVLADGVGAIRISAAFLDLDPDGPDDTNATVETDHHDEDPLAATGDGSGLGALLTTMERTAWRAAGGVVGGVLGGVRSPARLPGHAVEAVAMAQSLVRQLAVTEPARSPLWTGRHSLAHRFEVASVNLGTVKSAAKALGGTVNDLVVTAVAGAAGAYHRSRGVDVAELRMSMPISTRHDRVAGGNAWAPTRVLVPVGETDAASRFCLVRARLEAIKREPSLGLTGALAGLVRAVPAPLVLRLARQQAGTVDFACSNVRGAPFDLWTAGARVVANYPMGPTVGTAFNATVLSYRNQLDLGLNADGGSVDDPAELAGHISDAFDELFAAAR